MKKKIVIERTWDQEITTFEALIEMLACADMRNFMLENSWEKYCKINTEYQESWDKLKPLHKIDALARDLTLHRGILMGTVYQLLYVGFLSDREVRRLIDIC